MSATNTNNPIQKSVQEMGNNSYDTVFNQNTVEIVGYDGQNLQRTNADNLKVVHTNDSTYDYYSFASPGTAISSALWRIIRVDANDNVTYANGNANYTNIASNYASYTYS